MEPATLGLELSSDDSALDGELPCLLGDDLAGGSVRGGLGMTSSAGGGTQGFPAPCRKLQDSSQGNRLSGSTEDAFSTRPESQHHRYPIRGQVAVPPAPNSRQQPGFTIAQTYYSSATPFHETKAENGDLNLACGPLRTLAPLPATSPFILKSQPESSKAWKPFTADSPFILRSQPDEVEKEVYKPFVQKSQRDETKGDGMKTVGVKYNKGY